jgi:uncharacterized protein YjbJ (UPF0337 family)
LDIIAGQRDQLIEQLEVRYGMAKERAEKEVDAFVKSLQESKKAPGHR